MHILREWIRRLLGTLGRGRRDADLEMELRLHAELAAEQARRSGAAAADTAREARLRAGSVSQAMDALRDQRGAPRLDTIVTDVVFGWRQLNRHRSSTIVAIISLGLAIGATIGRRVIVPQAKDEPETTMEIIGLVGDAAYYSVREPMRPTVYVPIESRGGAAFVIRTAGEPMALAATLRREVAQARSDLRVRDVAPQTAFVRQQMIRERLLAALSSFFALVALALAAVGLYGVLNYAVVRRRREIGIRMALGARAGHVIRQVTTGMLALVCAGSLVGLGAAVAFGRFVEALLFQVRASDPTAMMLSLLALAVAAAGAALPPALRATRIDPAETLRTE